MKIINEEIIFEITKNQHLLENVRTNKNYELKLKNNDTLYYIHFWATYCKPCIEEFEEINKNYDKLSNGKTKLIIISFEDIDKQKTFLENRNYKMNFYKTDSSSFFIEPHIKYLPTTILLENETIKGKVIGTFNWSDINLKNI